MASIEVVSHCWNYHSPLLFQLSSVVRHPPAYVDLTVTIWHSKEDAATVRILDYFAAMEGAFRGRVSFRWRDLPTERLLRRAIGRNISALETGADLIWFADVDMWFDDGCFDQLPAEAARVSAPLMYPQFVHKNHRHEQGDQSLRAARDRLTRTGPELLDIQRGEFESVRQPRAIGGIQIVDGRVARQRGYLPHSQRYQRPSKRWAPNKDDVAFRKDIGSNGTPINLPGVYRIRHSENGEHISGLCL